MNQPPEAAAVKPTGRRRRWWWLGLLFLIVAGLALWMIASPKQVVHKGRTIDEWFADAGSPTNSVSTKAIQEFVEMGPGAVTYLVDRLSRPDSRWQAFYETVWNKCPATIRARLRPPRMQKSEKLLAVTILGRMGPNAAAAMPELVRQLDRDRTAVIGLSNAAGTSQKGGAPVPILGLAVTRHDIFDCLVRLDLTVFAIQKIGSDDPAVMAALLRQVDGSTAVVPFRLQDALRSPALEPARRKFLPQLPSAYAAGNSAQRQLVMHACHDLVVDVPEAMDLVIAGTRDPDSRVRTVAVGVLGEVHGRNELTVPVLVEALAGANTQETDKQYLNSTVDYAMELPSSAQSIAFYQALRQMPRAASNSTNQFEAGPAFVPAVNVLARSTVHDAVFFESLIKGLEHTNARVRAGSAMTLGRIGPSAARYRRELEARLSDSDPSVRYQSALAIWQTAGVIEPLMPYVLRKLSQGNAEERWSAVTFLEASGAGHPDIRRALEVQVLEDVDDRVRLGAANALGALKMDDAQTRQVLEQAAAKDPVPAVRAAATEALKKLGRIEPSGTPP